jgi:hypothetical protein
MASVGAAKNAARLKKYAFSQSAFMSNRSHSSSIVAARLDTLLGCTSGSGYNTLPCVIGTPW